MMDMDMSTSTAATATATASSSMSTTSSSSMDMDGTSMNTYLTTTFNDYPVIFKNLKSSNGGSAFGIFVLLFFIAIAMKGLFFLSAYLEQKVFHTYAEVSCATTPINSKVQETEKGCCSDSSSVTLNSIQGSALRRLFFPGFGEIFKDLIRLIITFVAAMLGYALMLGAMSFVVLYFFAICLGIAFGEVFFNRLSVVTGINQSVTLCGNLH